VSAPHIAVRKRLADITPSEEALLFERGRAADPDVERAVAKIISDVRANGDAALREQALRFDHAKLETVEVPRAICDAALAGLDTDVRNALEQAARAIADFHRAQMPAPLEVETRPGVRLGRRADPLDSVGVYAPGGRAAYPSSVLMGVVPARVAGVPQVIVCSPAGPDGLPPAAVLAACALARADNVFAIGGAGAIAAMALGTESVPRVAKVVGPGNAYVTEAKRQLTGHVAIDCPAGPSEVLVLADESASAEIIAAELMAQAEHDPDAAAVLVSTSGELCDDVATQLAKLIPDQPRKDIILQSLAARGALIEAGDLTSAIEFARRYAPEHLLVLTRAPRDLLPRLRSAGTIFLGAGSSVAFGDYITGANHVLPTATLARAYSGLSTLDFMRWTTYQEITASAAQALAAPTRTLANAEGLPAHAFAASLRAGSESDADSGSGAESGSNSGSNSGSSASASRSASGSAAPVRLRDAYRAIELYDPTRRAIAVDLSDNTNLFGASEAALRALREVSADAVTRYPPVFADELKEELAKLVGVDPGNITTGCGSDDVIDSALRAFCEPGDVVAYAAPTFSMVPLFVEMNALRSQAVPLGPGFQLDVDALVHARARATYVCTPNNPTGNVFERADIERLAQEMDGVLLLDEAYADFAESSMTVWAARSDRVISLRTLSKAHGLAGLRAGYAVGPATLIREIEKSRGPYKISATASAAALAVLRHDDGWVRDVARQVKENRARLFARLQETGLRVWPSEANFLLVRVPDSWSAKGFATALREEGVAVRAFPAIPEAGECFRVSIGPWSMLEHFLEAVSRVLASGAAAR
jgi:histidinol dehydrogenase